MTAPDSLDIELLCALSICQAKPRGVFLDSFISLFRPFFKRLLVALLLAGSGFALARIVFVPIAHSRPLLSAFFGKSPEKVIRAVSLAGSAVAEKRLRGYYMLDELALFDTEEKLRRLEKEKSAVNRLVLVMLLKGERPALMRAREIIGSEIILNDILDTLESPPPPVETRYLQ